MIGGEGGEEKLQADDDVHYPYQTQSQDVLNHQVVRPYTEGEVDGAGRQISPDTQQNE